MESMRGLLARTRHVVVVLHPRRRRLPCELFAAFELRSIRGVRVVSAHARRSGRSNDLQFHVGGRTGPSAAARGECQGNQGGANYDQAP